MEAEARRPRIGLVIGSGALKCAAALGLWKVLRREGIGLDMAVGCSGGAIYATLIAQERDVDDLVARNEGLWRGAFSRYHFGSILKAIFPRVFGFNEQFGLLDDRRVNAVLRELFGESTFEEVRIPLYLVSTDLLTGERVVLTSGRLRDAIRASSAIPFALRPWRIEGRLLFDGGASDPLPVDVAVREGCDIILAMGFEDPVEPRVDSAMALIAQTTTITVNHFLRSSYAFQTLAHHAEIIPMMPTFDRAVGFRDTHLLSYVIEQGAATAEKQVPYLRRLLADAEATSRIRV